MTITTGKTYEKVFEGYAPKSGLWWDKCTECNQTLDLPVFVLSAMRKAPRHGYAVLQAQKEALKVTPVLKHRSKRGQELHDMVLYVRQRYLKQGR